MSRSGLRTALLWMGVVGLPVVLSVVSYILTSHSLDASAGRLPVERLPVAQSDDPTRVSSDARSTAERTNRIVPSAAGAYGSDEAAAQTSHESHERGSADSEEPTGPDAREPSSPGSEEADDDWDDEEEAGGDD